VPIVQEDLFTVSNFPPSTESLKREGNKMVEKNKVGEFIHSDEAWLAILFVSEKKK